MRLILGSAVASMAGVGSILDALELRRLRLSAAAVLAVASLAAAAGAGSSGAGAENRRGQIGNLPHKALQLTLSAL
jgi:hypothetical protein